MADAPLSPVASPPDFAPVDLRPLTTSELIDRGFTLYRAHFPGFLLLALLGQTVPLLSQVLMTAFKIAPSPNEILGDPQIATIKATGQILSWTGVSLIGIFCYFCFEVVITFFIADAYLGQTPSVKASLRRFRSSLLPSLWTFLLTTLIIAGTFLFPLMAFIAAGLLLKLFPPASMTWLILSFGGDFILLVISLFPVLVIFMRLWLTIPAVALEGLSGWQAVKRSSALVRYDPGLGFFYWGEMRLSFLLLPLFVIELLVLSLTSLPVVLFQINEVLRHGAGGQVVQPPDTAIIASQILTFLAGSVILPLYSIATTLFYYDVRIRREGFDLEFMAKKLEERT